MIKKYNGQDIKQIVKEHFHFNVLPEKIGGFRDINYLLKDPLTLSNQYVLKISSFTQNQTCIKMQNYVLKQLKEQYKSKLKFQFPNLVPTAEEEDMVVIEEQGKKNFIRLFRYMQGKDMWDFQDLPPSIFESIGQLVGELSSFLSNISQNHQIQSMRKTFNMSFYPFNLMYFPTLYQSNKQYLTQDVSDIISTVKNDFDKILPILQSIPEQILHNDICSSNFRVSQCEGKPYIYGVLDFSDMTYGPRIIQLAVACARTNLDPLNPLKNIFAIIKAYNAIRELTSQQKIVLFPLIKARLSLLCLHSNKKLFDDNNEYTRKCNKGHRNYLQILSKASSNEHFLAELKSMI